MNEQITVAIPHSHAYKWLQISGYSAYAHDPGVPCKFIVVDNYLAVPWTIETLSTSDIGAHFTIIQNTCSNRFHASALDAALRITTTPFFFAMETDVRVLRGGWANWYLEQMDDVAIAGEYWTENESRMYVNPSATMYRTEPVREFDRQQQADLSEECWYIENGEWKSEPVSQRNENYWEWGASAFVEKRGFGPDKDYPLDKGRHLPGWYEPGQMLFYWLAQHYGWKGVENIHRYLRDGLAEGTWYGPSEEDAFMRHYWGGTSGHNWEKHATTGESINQWVTWWLEREHKVWCETVPDELREHAATVMRANKHCVPPEAIERAGAMGIGWYYDYDTQLRDPQGFDLPL